MIFWLKLIFDMIWNVKSKCNRMTLKLWWHKFNYMSKHTHMLLWETEQNMHLDVDFMLPDFIHAPQMDFLWTGQSGGPPTVWDQGLKYLLAVYKEKKKTAQQLVIESGGRRAEQIKLETSKGAHVILQPLLLWMSQKNQDYDATARSNESHWA